MRLQRGRVGGGLHAPQFREDGDNTHMKWKLSLRRPSPYDLNALYEDPQVSVLPIRLLLSAAMEMEYQVPETWRAEAAVGARASHFLVPAPS